mmetsp:Transcript_7747/g.19020  ORF Transcript_7747/g.19020 Transcript_7747/m.19020 type:complete len:289 (+) Transcript_7747:291-1157(+)
MSCRGTSSARRTAEDLKAKANDLFHRGKLGAAIDLYTEAFTFCPDWPVPLVNRALCHKLRENWSAVIDDTKKVIAMDSLNLKAHYFLGVALTQTQSFAGAVESLEQALELARETDAGIKEEVWRSLARAKYEKHSREASERAVRRNELLAKLQRLLKDEAAQTLRQMSAGTGSHGAGAIIDQAEILDKESKLLEDIFQGDAKKFHGDGDVPNWCTCQLTLEVFHEPMVTPCGISYEQTTLLEHFRKVGKFDPVTRRPCSAKDIRKNIGLRSAIENYLNENPWAWYYAM